VRGGSRVCPTVPRKAHKVLASTRHAHRRRKRVARCALRSAVGVLLSRTVQGTERARALHRLSRVRCSQPWPRPTTSHVPFPTEERRWHPQRSLLHRSRLQRPPGSRLLHKLHAAACAVLCGGTPRACHPVSVFVASERIRAARQHGMRTARSSAVAACSQSAPHPLPARPLARRTLRHIPTETRAPWVSLHPAAAHAHAFSCTRPRWRESHTRKLWHAPSAMAHSVAHILSSSTTLTPCSYPDAQTNLF